mmetsp:Transcript_43217/g.97678  ORF Transcript_43217/g.97678 Transcript_43217/m.97678 type:complete len:408 (-) Transcript_43217:171-1394(-)
MDIWRALVVALVVQHANLAAADENENCAGWARFGECAKNPGYMLVHCRQSCAGRVVPAAEAQQGNKPASPAFRWLREGDRSDETRQMWLAAAVSVSLFCLISFWVLPRQASRGEPRELPPSTESFWYVALFFLADYALIVAHRAWHISISGFYEGLWVCSLSLPLAACGLLSGRPALVAAALVSITCGHFVWSLDTALLVAGRAAQHAGLAGAEAAKEWRLGIASYEGANGYVTPLSAWAETHHLWFIPISVSLLSKLRPGSPLVTRMEVCCGASWVGLLSAVTALVVPRPCIPVVIDGHEACFHQNINMIYNWWGFDSWAFLHALDPSKVAEVSSASGQDEARSYFLLYWLWANIWYTLFNVFLLALGTAAARFVVALYGTWPITYAVQVQVPLIGNRQAGKMKGE